MMMQKLAKLASERRKLLCSGPFSLAVYESTRQLTRHLL